MGKLLMCRICLAEDVRMYCIVNTNLQEIYEMLSCSPLETKDRRSSLVCYICCARLRNCCRLQASCLASEQLFNEMLANNGLKPPTPDSNSLTVVHPVMNMDWIPGLNEPNDCDTKINDIKIDIKKEPSELVEVIVKEEYDENEDTVANIKMENTDETEFEDREDTPVANPSKMFTIPEYPQITIKRIKKSQVTEKPIENNLEQQINRNQTNLFRIKEKCFMKRIPNISEEINTSQMEFRCDICKKCFTQKADLIKHKRVHTVKKPFMCDVCQKCFSEKSKLIVHTRTHTGEKPFKCDTCGKCFSAKHNLIIHNRIHTGEKPYKCDICEKSFSEMGTLSIHNRVHTGEKPYRCEICTKSFSAKQHLIIHTRIHTGEKPYKCDTCKKCFSERGTLRKHTRIHTGERPYRCEVCQKCFSRQNTLIKHIRIHTGEKPYKCEICERCFRQRDVLVSHIRTHKKHE